MEILKKIKNKAENIYDGDPITIAFFGDSVTQGCFEFYRSKHGWYETVFDSEKGYPQKFISILRTVYSRVPFNIINAGLSGADTIMGVKHLERDVLCHRPDLTIVCFGLNDCTKGLPFLEEYKKNLSTIFQELKNNSSDIIFMTPNRMCTYVHSDIAEQLIETAKFTASLQNDGLLDTFVSAAKEVANQYDVKICDSYGIWNGLENSGSDTTLLLSNSLNHPIRDMHWLFANMLFLTLFQ